MSFIETRELVFFTVSVEGERPSSVNVGIDSAVTGADVQSILSRAVAEDP